MLSQIDTLGNVAFSVDITEYFELSVPNYEQVPFEVIS